MPNVMYSPPETRPPAPENARVPVPAQRPPTSYRWLWLVVGILALVTLLGAAFLVVGAAIAVNTMGGPAIASDQYYTAIRDQNYARAYRYLGAHLQVTLSREAFTRAAQQQDALAGKVSHYTYTAVSIGDPADVTMTDTRANGTSYPVHLEMRRENGVWKVTAFDRI